MEAKKNRFVTTDDIEFMKDHAGFWKNRFSLLHYLEEQQNMPVVTEQFMTFL